MDPPRHRAAYRRLVYAEDALRGISGGEEGGSQLAGFLQALSLAPELLTLEGPVGLDEADAVALATIHAAKASHHTR